jgi:hypothetical protein
VAAINSKTVNAAGSSFPEEGQNVSQGINITGWWTYGKGVQLGASVSRFRVLIPRVLSGSGSLNFYLYGLGGSGSPIPIIDGPTVAQVTAGQDPAWFELPAAWGQSIVNNGGGVAVSGGPPIMLAGISSDPASGQLEFLWTADVAGSGTYYPIP